jgi:hypothetical protein
MNNRTLIAIIGWILFMIAGLITGNNAWFPVAASLPWISAMLNVGDS